MKMFDKMANIISGGRKMQPDGAANLVLPIGVDLATGWFGPVNVLNGCPIFAMKLCCFGCFGRFGCLHLRL